MCYWQGERSFVQNVSMMMWAKLLWLDANFNQIHVSRLGFFLGMLTKTIRINTGLEPEIAENSS